MSQKERERSRSGDRETDFYVRRLGQSQAFRREDAARRELVKAQDMPWENGPQGLLKHMVNEEMDTREYCLDIYQQLLAASGRSGRHRHLSEEVLYVLEGRGWDLHWDVRFDCRDAYIWDWDEEPQKFAWEEGDFVYIPPYCIHQHFNADAAKPARLISVTSRIIKAIGFDWIDQLENAPEYGET